MQERSFVELFDSSSAPHQPSPSSPPPLPSTGSPTSSLTHVNPFSQSSRAPPASPYPSLKKRASAQTTATSWSRLVSPIRPLSIWRQSSRTKLTSTPHQTKRRVLFTRAVKDLESKAFLVRCPAPSYEREQWVTLCLDLGSFAQCFKAKYSTVSRVTIGAPCLLRRVVSLRHEINCLDFGREEIAQDVKEVPKPFELAFSQVKLLSSAMFFKGSQKMHQTRKEASKEVSLEKRSKEKSLEKRSTGTTRNLSISREGKGLPQSFVVHKKKTTKNPWSQPTKKKSDKSKIQKPDCLTQTNWQNSQVTASDSQYLQASHRFNTINDPKFFKRVADFQAPKEEDEIEQNLEVEDSRRNGTEYQQPEEDGSEVGVTNHVPFLLLERLVREAEQTRGFSPEFVQ